MDYSIAIPSYNRLEGIQKKTLSLLNKYNIDKNKIYIFVNTDEQKKQYEDNIPKNLYGQIITTNQPKGIKNVRNYITSFFPLNKKFVSMDDDVIAIKEIVANKLVNIKDLNSLIIKGFELCEKFGFTLWGLYPVANAFYMRNQNEYTTDLRFIVGSFIGIINKKRLVSLNYKEDYELSLEAYSQDGGIIRFNRIAIKHSLYLKTGGIGTSQLERLKENINSSNFLLNKYPNLVKINPNRDGEILISSRGAGLNNNLVNYYKIDKTEKIKNLQKQLYEKLEETSIPRIEGKRKDKKPSRGDKLGYNAWTFTFGCADRRARGYGELKTNEKFPELLDLLIQYGNEICPKNFEYSTITVNKDMKAKKHIDGLNSGDSVISGLGDFTGGNLLVYEDGQFEPPKEYNLKNHILIFNGAELYHRTTPFEGRRYTIIFYNQRGECQIKTKMMGKTKY